MAAKVSNPARLRSRLRTNHDPRDAVLSGSVGCRSRVYLQAHRPRSLGGGDDRAFWRAH